MGVVVVESVVKFGGGSDGIEEEMVLVMDLRGGRR